MATLMVTASDQVDARTIPHRRIRNFLRIVFFIHAEGIEGREKVVVQVIQKPMGILLHEDVG